MPGIASVGTKTMCMCSFGMAPAPLFVPPGKVMAENFPFANVTCTPKPGVCDFAMCQSMANPAVAAATAAAMGVLTPQKCTPNVVMWTPGVTKVLVGNMPALNNTCTAQCAFGGVITITNPGATKVMA